jgi:RNA polymerase sigma-70 factor (ECF subfamily)
MEDAQIIALYWARDEAAIRESERQYGRYCTAVAQNILHAPPDAEECVNDTWLHAWNVMPPQKPNRLQQFFARITRNLAIDRLRRHRSEKAGGGQLPLCLDELSEVIGEEQPFPEQLALRELLDRFLSALPDRQREMFLLRYWYLLPVRELAERFHTSEGAVKMSLSRIRRQLRDELEKEGYSV